MTPLCTSHFSPTNVLEAGPQQGIIGGLPPFDLLHNTPYLFQQSTECYRQYFVVEVLNMGSRNRLWKSPPIVHSRAQGLFSREGKDSQANQILSSVIQKGLRTAVP